MTISHVQLIGQSRTYKTACYIVVNCMLLENNHTENNLYPTRPALDFFELLIITSSVRIPNNIPKIKP